MKKISYVFLLTAFLVTMLGNPAAQPVQAAGTYYSLKFYGHGTGQIDRVKIPIDAPEVPADVGGDFTIEFWMKAASADNTSGACTPGGNNWVNGNIIIDRDIFGTGDFGDYGISLYGGKIAFGVASSATNQTLCSTAGVADNAWHHIALTRIQTSGQMRIFIDGALDATGTGPTGDVSYHNGRVTAYPDSDPYLVFGAEKHDAGSSFPSYNGYLDEVRISNNVRYSATFTRPIAPLPADANTLALYRFDEGPAGACSGGILDSSTGGASGGACSYGGDSPSGPVYTTDNPPIYQPDLVVTGYQFLNSEKSAVITEPTEDVIFWIRMTVENRGGGDSGNFYPGVFLDNKPNYGPDHDEPPILNLGDVTDYEGYRITPSGAVDGAGCMYYDPAGSIKPLSDSVFTERGNYTRQDILPSLPAGSSTTVDVEIAYPDPPYTDPIYDTDNVRSGLKRGGYSIYLYADPNCSGGEEEINETNNDYGPIYIQMGYTFDDVPPTAFAWSQIESIYAAGITGGCTTNPLNYCPGNAVTRSQMAIFLLRGIHGSSYTPPPASGAVFGDVSASSFGAAWIEQFVAEGITAGCGGGNYCPSNPVTRSQMAIFLLRAKYGSSYSPPPASGTVFSDVPANGFAAAWIEQLVAEGITAGCGSGKYCPNSSVIRSQMAIFIQRTFNLPLP